MNKKFVYQVGNNKKLHKKAVIRNVGTVLECETTSCRAASCGGMSIAARMLTKSQNMKSKRTNSCKKE